MPSAPDLLVMYQKKIAPDFECGIVLTKEVLNGKWKSSLLYQIAMGVQRPSALQRNIPDATRRVLNVQLNELERHGLISKTIYPQLPPKVEYSLTDFGRTLLPVIEAMTHWGNEHRERLEQILLPSH
ncbi:winged helix-turn-helix transcriptional regulator [Hymenobacter rubidus]|uniref:winged helix-turn-helix transcriptional regulator n=1 Tax=Hymenobacter rubidus TaxID=1441626 RepID=UPI001F233237|nr:helix-turn-helix domain-containing protein [Hymenobacter rubidus]